MAPQADESQKLSLSQGTSEIVVIETDAQVSINAITTVSGEVYLTSDTAATSSTVAALVVSGGVGVALDLIVAGSGSVSVDFDLGNDLTGASSKLVCDHRVQREGRVSGVRRAPSPSLAQEDPLKIRSDVVIVRYEGKCDDYPTVVFWGTY